MSSAPGEDKSLSPGVESLEAWQPFARQRAFRFRSRLSVRLRPQVTVEELEQAALCGVWRSLQLRGPKRNLMAYMRRAAGCSMSDYMRQVGLFRASHRGTFAAVTDALRRPASIDAYLAAGENRQGIGEFADDSWLRRIEVEVDLPDLISAAGAYGEVLIASYVSSSVGGSSRQVRRQALQEARRLADVAEPTEEQARRLERARTLLGSDEIIRRAGKRNRSRRARVREVRHVA